MGAILRAINDWAPWGAGMAGLVGIWATAREARRGAAHPDVTVGPVDASGGLGAAGGTPGMGSVGRAVREPLRAPGAGRHREGGRVWSLRVALWHAGGHRVSDMGLSATAIVWRVRTEAIRMLRDSNAILTMASLKWAAVASARVVTA